jgi:hypothetical protein
METDIVELAARALEKHGYRVTRHDTSLEHPESGLIMKPAFGYSSPSERQVGATSAITTSHPQLFPRGVFEYQHTVGDTLDNALFRGFDLWVQTDFVVFLDALRDRLQKCRSFHVTFEPTDGPALQRRAVLGPVEYMSMATIQGTYKAADGEHPFCPCCFLQNTFDTFLPLVQNDALYAIRMFAARDASGKATADCRVNGEDWEAGKQALIEYADTWPQVGLEQRKQYVILQTRTGGGGVAPEASHLAAASHIPL